MRLCLAFVASVGGVCTFALRASADPSPLEVHADLIDLDSRTQELYLRGNVHLDSEPFHLTASELRLSRSSRGVVVKGEGRIAFCPCLGQPLAVAFRGATVAPPGDLLLDQPTLEVFHLPVLWSPFFWLRSPGKVGLLPPDIAYRGADGLFLGEGLHLPWRAGDTESGLDVHAGAYLKGGVATAATLKTPDSVTTVRWDHLQSDGFGVDARGARVSPSSAAAKASVAWDADILSGQRGVVATTDVDAASRVFDRASGEAALRDGGWTLSSGVRATNVRGADFAELGAAGPVASARRGGTLGDAGAYDARVDGGVLAGAGLVTTSFAKAGSDAILATHVGPVRLAWSLRGAGDVAASGANDAYEGSVATRGEIALPVVRAFDSEDPRDPWRHRLAPRIEVGALAAGDGATAFGASSLAPTTLLGDFPSAGGLSGLAWIADGGFETALGRWAARDGLELRAAAGAVGGNQEGASPVIRWNGAASFPWLGMGAEGAHVFGAGLAGDAVAARLRVGSLNSLHLGVTVAERGGIDPVVARALTDAPDATSMGFLATEGWTAGGRVTLPLTGYLTARGGAEGDLTAQKLVAARASLEFHDRCGCVVVSANGAERIGRPGIDVWLSVSLARR